VTLASMATSAMKAGTQELTGCGDHVTTKTRRHKGHQGYQE